MFDLELFVREMSRRVGIGEIDLARQQLWSLNHDVLNIIQPSGQPLVALPDDTIEVNAVYADGFPLSRTRDILLDAGDPEWRSADADLPTCYIWHGEEGRFIRLHPVPAFEQELWIICQRIPVQFYPKWFNLIIALHAVEQLSMSDQVIGRQPMAQYCQGLKEMIYASTAKELQAQQRGR